MYTRILLSHKKNEIMPFEATRIVLEIIKLSEASQTTPGWTAVDSAGGCACERDAEKPGPQWMGTLVTPPAGRDSKGTLVEVEKGPFVTR